MPTDRTPPPTSLADLAEPLCACLREHFPSLSEEARIAFAVQIVMAHERRHERPGELYHFRGARSAN